MSATILYALVMLQGADINIAPGYTSKAECQSAAPSQGGFSTCQAYAPDGKTWTLFSNTRTASDLFIGYPMSASVKPTAASSAPNCHQAAGRLMCQSTANPLFPTSPR